MWISGAMRARFKGLGTLSGAGARRILRVRSEKKPASIELTGFLAHT
jgi:hypothetical protein